MRAWLALLFVLVQVGSTTYVNPEYIVAVHSTRFTLTTISFVGGAEVRTDWSVEQVIEALKRK